MRGAEIISPYRSGAKPTKTTGERAGTTKPLVAHRALNRVSSSRCSLATVSLYNLPGSPLESDFWDAMGALWQVVDPDQGAGQGLLTS